jgi:hypothetical protein
VTLVSKLTREMVCRRGEKGHFGFDLKRVEAAQPGLVGVKPRHRDQIGACVGDPNHSLQANIVSATSRRAVRSIKKQDGLL